LFSQVEYFDAERDQSRTYSYLCFYVGLLQRRIAMYLQHLRSPGVESDAQSAFTFHTMKSTLGDQIRWKRFNLAEFRPTDLFLWK